MLSRQQNLKREGVAVNNQLLNNELGLYTVYYGKFKLKGRQMDLKKQKFQFGKQWYD